MALNIGFDVGGTFTDIVVTHEDGAVEIEKLLSTPHDPAIGAKRGIESLLARRRLSVGEVDLGIHGTTLVTNAIIERKGSLTGMLTTRGFRDILEIGHGTRYDIYDLFLEFPESLIERRLRLEIDGRIDHRGDELEPVRDADVRRALERLSKEGVQAVAVCLLHSYANPAHELQVRALAEQEFPDLRISLSSDVLPRLGEYERFSTTTANAYVQPLVDRYVAELDEWLGGGRLLLMGSNGGTLSSSTARRWPVTLLESGPAAGALAAAEYSRRMDRRRVVSFDMGGTTAKVCLVDDGEPLITADFETARTNRFKPGSGLPIGVPTINMIEIGAGGGSIASLDAMGLLKVGPTSAGAEPGPACYGLGGMHPTVTDANLLLGYLAAQSFLGGEFALDPEAAAAAISEHIARPLGIDQISAAWGIHEIVNENMAAAMRTHFVERNRDPRQYTLVAFGGAAPAHACELARKTAISEVVIPFGAGATSAFGLLMAPSAVHFVHTSAFELNAIDWDVVARIYEELDRTAHDLLADAGVSAAEVTLARSVDMRYVGQAHEIEVPLLTDIRRNTSDSISDSFRARYGELYNVLNPGFAVEILNWRLKAAGPARNLSLVAHATDGADLTAAHRDSRPVYFSEFGEAVETPVFDHARLSQGTTFRGPAIIEQRETTTVVGPDDSVLVDELGSLLIALRGQR